MSSRFRSSLILVVSVLCIRPLLAADAWSQFGGNARHTSSAALSGQPLVSILADVIYDPFEPLEADDGGGDLYVHYPAPLIDGDDVFMEFKSGTYLGLSVWQSQTRSIHRLHWEGGQLVDKWAAVSDWVPVPFGGGVSWEPVFHAVLANGFLYTPGVGGTVMQFDRGNGQLIKRINPFGTSVDQDTYVSGPLSVDATGNILYTAIRFDHADAWHTDIKGAWLIRIAVDGGTKRVPFTTIVPGAPNPSGACLVEFSLDQKPWPPSPDAVPPSIPCGSQRPGINIAPAIAPDGTIYVMSRAHFDSYYSYLVGVNSDLTLKWTASLRNRFHDGCNVFLPPEVTKGGCRAGAITGVDPAQNVPGAGRVIDQSSASPVVAPDGSIFYGSYTGYNDGQGHLMHFASDGSYLGAYPFGWDTTPAIYVHDATYSVITKENHYDTSGPTLPDPSFFITQLDPNLNIEWQFQSTTTHTCGPDSQGQISCTDEHPFGFEWCVNAPAVDAQGTVYANSEDRILYAIRQGGVLLDRIFLQVAQGAAYTPVAIGADGRIYAQNAGHLFAIGGTRPRVRAAKH